MSLKNYDMKTLPSSEIYKLFTNKIISLNKTKISSPNEKNNTLVDKPFDFDNLNLDVGEFDPGSGHSGNQGIEALIQFILEPKLGGLKILNNNDFFVSVSSTLVNFVITQTVHLEFNVSVPVGVVISPGIVFSTFAPAVNVKNPVGQVFLGSKVIDSLIMVGNKVSLVSASLSFPLQYHFKFSFDTPLAYTIFISDSGNLTIPAKGGSAGTDQRFFGDLSYPSGIPQIDLNFSASSNSTIPSDGLLFFTRTSGELPHGLIGGVFSFTGILIGNANLENFNESHYLPLTLPSIPPNAVIDITLPILVSNI